MGAPAVVVLGMHRSGTSCVAGMLSAAGVAAVGDDVVRNWDNALGHHERLDVVRLDEAVLAYSGGHWLAPPAAAAVRWTPAHAEARDRLLGERVAGRPPLLKDPRMLVALPCWRAAPVPFDVVGVVRHPLAVARSLASWRGVPIVEGVALWTAHCRALAEDRARHGYTVVDFDAPGQDIVAAVARACAAFAPGLDEAALARAYDADRVHHDERDDGHDRDVAGLDAAIALYRELVGGGGTRARRDRRPFPHAALAAATRALATGDPAAALASAREALASIADASAVLVPAVTAFVRAGALVDARALVAEHAARVEPGLAALLHGKIALALGDADAGVEYLAAACTEPQPLFQARALWPHALRLAGRRAEARAALAELATVALYPHRALATLAEWSHLDGDPRAALADMAGAIDAAPPHRRGRLRTRRADWLRAAGDTAAAAAELALAVAEDPGYTRAAELLARHA